MRLLCDERNSCTGDPGVRIDQFCECRQLMGGAPDAIQPLNADLLDDGVAEALPVAVLAQLELEAEDLLEQAHRTRAAHATALQGLAELGLRGDDLGADGVHDV